MEIDIELLKRLKADMEDSEALADDYRGGRSKQKLIEDGEMPDSYYELCKLIEGK